MKKVLHVVGGMDIGGTETMLMNIYRNIDREKIEFHFISYYGRKGFYDDEIEKLGGKIIPLNFSKKYGAFGSLYELKKILSKGKYDVIHGHTLFNCGFTMAVGWLSGVKIRITHSHTTFERKDDFLKKLYMNLMRGFIRIFSTDYLACSKKAGIYLFGKNILENKKYRFLPNYVDYKRFIKDYSKDELRKNFKIEDDEIVLGHVGRFMEAKNHEFILKIAEEMKKNGKKIKVIFVGDGNLRESIEKKIREYKLEEEVLITGMVKDTEKYMKIMDIFLLPSIYEGFGLVALEAQGSGIPVLASENVQEEVDLEIGLFKKINLDLGIKIWIEEIENILKHRKNYESRILEEAFINKGYDLKKIVDILDGVYGGA